MPVSKIYGKHIILNTFHSFTQCSSNHHSFHTIRLAYIWRTSVLNSVAASEKKTIRKRKMDEKMSLKFEAMELTHTNYMVYLFFLSFNHMDNR